MTTIRPRRSALYMPGSNSRALEKARELAADVLILDLEDAVAPEAKATAREQVCAAVQAGGYGEHRFDAVTVNGKRVAVNGPVVTVRLEPGAGARLEFQMSRYVNRPTFAFPWDRAWYPAAN